MGKRYEDPNRLGVPGPFYCEGKNKDLSFILKAKEIFELLNENAEAQFVRIDENIKRCKSTFPEQKSYAMCLLNKTSLLSQHCFSMLDYVSPSARYHKYKTYELLKPEEYRLYFEQTLENAKRLTMEPITTKGYLGDKIIIDPIKQRYESYIQAGTPIYEIEKKYRIEELECYFFFGAYDSIYSDISVYNFFKEYNNLDIYDTINKLTEIYRRKHLHKDDEYGEYDEYINDDYGNALPLDL